MFMTEKFITLNYVNLYWNFNDVVLAIGVLNVNKSIKTSSIFSKLNAHIRIFFTYVNTEILRLCKVSQWPGG